MPEHTARVGRVGLGRVMIMGITPNYIAVSVLALAGIAAGCAVAAPAGLYDLGRVMDAPWFGLPQGGFPGLDLTPTAGFWALLPIRRLWWAAAAS